MHRVDEPKDATQSLRLSMEVGRRPRTPFSGRRHFLAPLPWSAWHTAFSALMR